SDKFRGTSVTLSADFKTEGNRSGLLAYGPTRGKNVSAAYYRWTSVTLSQYSAIRMDVKNPTDHEIAFRLGISTRSGEWCEYAGNVGCSPKTRATVEFNLDRPIYGSRINTGIARIVLIIDPSESPGEVYIDNIRLLGSRER
ncbi:unnamed protein product, partial [marine sediment metagenome]